MAGYVASRAKQNKGFVTKAARQQQEEQRIASYGPIPLRIEFPDGYIIQGFFPVTSTLQSIHDLVAAAVQPQHISNFYLFTAPPKKTLQKIEETTLYSAGLIPAARLHVGLTSSSTTDNNSAISILNEAALALCSEPPLKSETMKQHRQEKKDGDVERKEDASVVQKAAGSGANLGGKKSGGGAGGIPKWMRLSNK